MIVRATNDVRATAQFLTTPKVERIDEPAAGWKGKGIGTAVSTRAPFHKETGKGTTSKVVTFQMRTDPLAK